MYQIHRVARYVKELGKLDGHYHSFISAFEQKLKEEPFSGKPLSFEFLREKKFDDKRLLYIVYPDLKKILFVAITDKRNQQEAIDFIKAHFKEYLQRVEKL